MVIGLSLNQSIAIPCSLCKRTKCGADCLLQRHRTLSSQQKHIQCPKCHAHDVDINVDDDHFTIEVSYGGGGRENIVVKMSEVASFSEE